MGTLARRGHRAPALLVRGRLERVDGVASLVAEKFTPLDLGSLVPPSRLPLTDPPGGGRGAWTHRTGLGEHASGACRGPESLRRRGLAPVRWRTLLLGWQGDDLALLAVAVTVALAACYLFGGRRLAARGRRWSGWRTAAFLGGAALVVVAIDSGLASYDDSVFELHALQHELLMNLAPILFALSAPATLALQALRRDHQRLLLRALHSRAFAAISFPPLAAALSYGLMIVYFLSSFYGLSQRHPLLHDATHLVFLVSGCLYWWPVVGVDPSRWRLSFPARLGYLATGIPVTALLGLGLTTGGSIDPAVHTAADTRAGGAVLWVVGELVTLGAIAVVLVQLMHADERAAARYDRRMAHEAANAAARHRPRGRGGRRGRAGGPGAGRPPTPSTEGPGPNLASCRSSSSTSLDTKRTRRLTTRSSAPSPPAGSCGSTCRSRTSTTTPCCRKHWACPTTPWTRRCR